MAVQVIIALSVQDSTAHDWLKFAHKLLLPRA